MGNVDVLYIGRSGPWVNISELAVNHLGVSVTVFNLFRSTLRGPITGTQQIARTRINRLKVYLQCVFRAYLTFIQRFIRARTNCIFYVVSYLRWL